MDKRMFLDERPDITKVAAAARLGMNAQNWEEEILDNLYRTLPFLNGYDVSVRMDRISDDLSYGYGHAVVKNKTNADPTAGPLNVPHMVKLPLVVQQRNLAPVDIMLIPDEQRYMPCTEWRLNEFMLNPTLFGVQPAPVAGDAMLTDTLAAPQRGASGYISDEGIGKMASGSLLLAIEPTITKEDHQRFVSVLKQDNAVLMEAMLNKQASEVFDYVLRMTPQSQALDVSRPHVVHVEKTADGSISILWGDPRAFDGVHQVEITGAEEGDDYAHFLAKCAEAPSLEVDDRGSLSVLGERVSSERTFSVYRAKTAGGEEIDGLLFPRMMRIDGSPMGGMLFASPKGISLQEEAYLEKHASATPPHPVPADEEMRGTGVLYVHEGPLAVCTEPFTVIGRLEKAGSAVVETIDGARHRLEFHKDLLHPVDMGDGRIAIPETMKFMEVSPQMMDLQKSAGDLADLRGAVTLTYGDGSFRLRGGAVEDLPHDFLSRGEAEFALGMIGASPEFAREKTAQAIEKGELTILGAKAPRPLDHLLASALQKSAEALGKMALPSKVSLVKEAAMVQDADTVDKILALGFLTPENATIFASYLPAIEHAEARMAELLLAARVGQKELEEGALTKALASMETVVQGLRRMSGPQQPTDQEVTLT